jgi:protein TonB
MRSWLRNLVYISLAISLLIHLVVGLGLHFSKVPPWQDHKDKVEVVILDQSPSEKKAVADEVKKQIVEQPDKALNDETPEDAKYMSAHNQRVVHETKAQQTGDFHNSQGQGNNLPSAKPAPAPVAKTEQMAEQRPKMKNKSKGQPAPDDKGQIPTLSDLSPRFEPYEHRQEQTDAGSGQAPSQTNDFLKDTPPSLETVLNTREFIYYSYYQRIRTQIRQYWEPNIREIVKKIYASGRTIASEHDHITRVIIVLDSAGKVIKVQVVGESGVKDLDDAAVNALRSAAQFPNPPKGIVDADGTIKINWDFILEADNLPSQVVEPRYADDR